MDKKSVVESVKNNSAFITTMKEEYIKYVSA